MGGGASKERKTKAKEAAAEAEVRQRKAMVLALTYVADHIYSGVPTRTSFGYTDEDLDEAHDAGRQYAFVSVDDQFCDE